MRRVALFFLMIEKCCQADCDGSYRTDSYCAGFQYDSAKETCVPCPNGFFGLACRDPCPYPQFGNFCQKQCSCNINECDNVRGCAQYINSHSGITVHNKIIRTNRTTSNLLSSSAGFNKVEKMSSTSIHKVTYKYDGSELSKGAIHENNEAPIRISILILLCSSGVILLLYAAL